MTYILAYMDFLAPTGFATVSENIFKRIAPFLEGNDIKIDVLSRNLGDKDKVEFSKNITVYHPRAFQEKGIVDDYYRNGMLRRLTAKPYEVLWIMEDVKFIEPLLVVLDGINKKKGEMKQTKFKTVFYTPIDSKLISVYFRDFNLIDKLVTYTNYGKRQIEDAFASFDPPIKKGIQVIPHGIDIENFRPLKEDFREKYNLPAGRILFGSVNKNQPRKDIGTTLLAFERMLYSLKNANIPEEELPALYLHCHPLDPSGINIYAAADALGLKLGQDYFLPLKEKYDAGEYTEEEMNELYNCFDCFIGTSMAEGWGLTYTQALAVGLSVICGNHTSLSEIMHHDNNNLVNLVIKLHEHFQINDGSVVRYKLDIMDTAVTMMDIYRQLVNTEDKFALKQNRVQFYQPIFERYQWDEIAASWIKVLTGVISKSLKSANG